jgi:hypothetical protein
LDICLRRKDGAEEVAPEKGRFNTCWRFTLHLPLDEGTVRAKTRAPVGAGVV